MRRGIEAPFAEAECALQTPTKQEADGEDLEATDRSEVHQQVVRLASIRDPTISHAGEILDEGAMVEHIGAGGGRVSL